MSSPSTVRRFGTAKTYGRARENTASRSFDEMLTGKPAPIKASPAYTKWGKTNFVAIRGDKKPILEDPGEKMKEEPQVKLEDPFSFDSEDKRRASPTKPRVVVTAEPQRSTTRLPASRIVTQLKKGQVATGSLSSDDSEPPATAIARPGRTYTRAQEGRVSPGSSQLVMDQFLEVGKTVKTNAGLHVVYSIQPHVPTESGETPEEVASAPPCAPSPEKKPRRDYSRVDHSSSSQPSSQEEAKRSPFSDDEEDDDDIFPATFRRTPLKTYSGEIITPISDASDDPISNKKKKKKKGNLPRGRKPSRYTDPALINEYRQRYAETHGRKEPTAGMFNSTVVSSKELRSTQGTTLVVVCKPKVELSEKKDDVQTKYFKNVKKELDKSDRNLGAAEVEMETGEEEEEEEEDASSSAATDSETPGSTAAASPCLKKPPAASPITPTRLLKVHFADEVSDSPASSSSVPLSSPEKPIPKKAPAPKAREEKAAVVVSSSQSSTSSGSTATVASRTRSGGKQTAGKQYRIFKSRGPQPPTIQPEADLLLKEDVANNTNSPQMPELTPEDFESSDNLVSDHQNPPDIVGKEEEESEVTSESVQPEQTTSEDQSPPLTDSQPVISVSSEETSEKSGEPVADSPSSQVKPFDSQDTLSPASDDSQELSQEIPSSADNSQKEDSTPAAPRRFFKSKKSSSASSLQRKVFEKSPSKASYNVRSWQKDDESGEKRDGPPPAKVSKKTIPFGDDAEAEERPSKEPKLIRSVHWSRDRDQESYTSLKVQKRHKGLYTVVHNVKMAHEVQESGETQDFMDDVEYLLENLKDNQPFPIRALSTLQLAGRCILPAFRMHLRAHGTVTKIFSLLHDACSNSCLALSTATMMFMLSRDRLNMDLDKESLHLMLKLNEVDIPRSGGGGTEEGEDAAETGGAEEESGELQKCRGRVQELLVQLQRETNAKQIDLGFVSTGNLAMESLLSLTSRRAGEWFKEELRMLGGLDHFVESINHCVSDLKGDLADNLDDFTPRLKKLDRCLRVLENITFNNSDNQTYLISYKKGLLITITGSMLQQCVASLPCMPLQEMESEEALREQAGWIVFDCLLAVLRVMLNITHNSEFGCTRFGEEAGLLEAVVQCVVNTQWCVPPDQRFDLLVLSLGLLVNLMEHCAVNRRQLITTSLTARIKEEDEPAVMDAVKALVLLFLQRESAARQMEEAPESPTKEAASPNKSGEWHESDSGIQWIAKSAEKVKAAEKEEQRKDASFEAGEGTSRLEEGEGGGGDGDKPMDGASILEDEETFTKALHKAGKHMENSIVASYVGLLLGCFIQDNSKYVEAVKRLLPDGSFEPMVKILKKFLSFMSLTTAIGTTDGNSIQRVIDMLEDC